MRGMSEIMTERIVLAARPEGMPKPSDFRLERAVLPAVPAGHVALRALYLSLDPYMRGRMDDRKSYAKPTPVGGVMEGECVAEVIGSESPDLRPGDVVLARIGWQSHAVVPAVGLHRIDPDLAPLTTRLGVLGMPGFTAYGGLKVIGQPKPGETVVVAAASGPVGSLVGQLARQWGCRAVGIAGGEDKRRYVVDDLGFDAAVDHRAPDFPQRLAAACPQGVDVYFENVAGAVWQAVLPLFNLHARVPVSGLIAQYNGTEPGAGYPLEPTMREILNKRLRIQGFINFDFHEAHHAEFLRSVSVGVRSGAIRYREDVTDGLSNAPAAFIDMLAGKNFGKALVKVAEPALRR